MTLAASLDLLLALGLTLRTTRIITGDDIGLWWIRGPITFWAMRHDTHQTVGTFGPSETVIPGWRSKISIGLTCPFCIGFWIAGAVLLSLSLAGGPGDAAEWWRWVAGWFTLNWLAAHVGSRLGDAGYADDEDRE